MSNSYFIALTLGMAAVTFLIRFSFIGLAGKIQMSERVTKTLRFVPVTVLPAIITIQILSVNSSMEFDGNDSNLLIVFYVQIMPDDFVMQLHRF